MMRKKCIGIIGTGKISQEYVNIFKKIDVEIKIVCARNKKKLHDFCLKNNIKKNTLIISDLLNLNLDGVIVCASPDSSLLISKQLVNFKGKILFEKPVGLNLAQTENINKLYQNKNNFYVALNRRYYHSVVTSKKLMNMSKNRKFISICDQENTIEAKKSGHKNSTIKNWMFANSIHLVDLINFYIKSKVVGVTNIKNIRKNHKLYFSIIKFQNGDIVEFKSFWNKPAPWKINISFDEKFVQLKPIENISYIDKSSREIKKINIDKKDIIFKPGFFRQSEDFKKALQNKKNSLVSLENYLRSVNLTHRIFFN